MENKKYIYIYVLSVSAFLSISLFEILVAAGVLWCLYDFFKDKKLECSLKIPLVSFIGIALISTLINYPKLINKALEEGLFQFLYFFKINPERKFVRNLVFLFIVIGVLLIPVILYHFYKIGVVKPIWGGWFEVGQFYAFMSIMAIGIAIYYLSNKNKKLVMLFSLLFIFFITIEVLSTRRSAILALTISLLIFIFVLYRNKIIKKQIFFAINSIFLISLISGYIYLSKTDPRFQILNYLITHPNEINYQTLNRLSSTRVDIGSDAIKIIENDIKNKNILNLLIGHGIWSGAYLPHEKSPKDYGKYESFILLSEFIEIGLLGIIAEIAIFFIFFKKFIKAKIKNKEDIFAILLFIPLSTHLLGALFTFFWDALLPLYLLLFKIGEKSLEESSQREL